MKLESFRRVWEDLIKSKIKDGKCIFLKTEESNAQSKLREATTSVSTGHGVYAIYGVNDNDEQELIYIGKSGEVLQTGNTCKQGLKGRLKNKQEGMPRAVFFCKVMTGERIPEKIFKALRIKWIETYCEGVGKPPFLAEAQLLAAYLEDNKQLPALNKTA